MPFEKYIDILSGLFEEATIEKNIDVKNVQPDDDLKSFGINSVTYVKFIILIEEEFDIEFEIEDISFKEHNTFRKIIEIIKEVSDR